MADRPVATTKTLALQKCDGPGCDHGHEDGPLQVACGCKGRDDPVWDMHATYMDGLLMLKCCVCEGVVETFAIADDYDPVP